MIKQLALGKGGFNTDQITGPKTERKKLQVFVNVRQTVTKFI